MPYRKINVWKLIHTGEKENISLAIELAKSQEINLDFRPYLDLFKLMKSTYPFRNYIRKVDSDLEDILHCILNIKNLKFFQDMVTSNIGNYFYLLHNLERVSISNFDTPVLPSTFCTFPHLKQLILNNYKKTLRLLPQQIGQLEYLEQLTVQYLGQTQLPNSITGLSRLKSLHLETETYLHELPENFEQLENLQELSLSFKEPIDALKSIEQIAGLKQLRSLYLSIEPAIELEDLPTGFYQMYQLKELELKGIILNTFPAQLPNRSKMTRLSIDNYSFAEIPDSIQEWKNLDTLELKKGNLKNLPAGLNKLQNLEALIIEDNSLEEFPIGILALSHLEELSLKGNKLSIIPDILSQLNQLYHLNISNNLITELPSLSQIVRLDCNHNQLNEFPIFLREQSKIQFLSLEHNQIKQLPDWFGELKNLEELSLKHNKLESLPDSILELSGSISEIDLSYNQFKVFPNILFKDSYFLMPDFNANYCYFNFDFNQFPPKEIKYVLMCTEGYEDHNKSYSRRKDL